LVSWLLLLKAVRGASSKAFLSSLDDDDVVVTDLADLSSRFGQSALFASPFASSLWSDLWLSPAAMPVPPWRLGWAEAIEERQVAVVASTGRRRRMVGRWSFVYESVWSVSWLVGAVYAVG